MRTLLAECRPPEFSSEERLSKLRFGFLGADSAGRRAMESAAGSGVAKIVAIADESPNLALQAARIHTDAAVLSSLDDFLEVGVDGVVIATPGALNVAQAVNALERGVTLLFVRTNGRAADQMRGMVHAIRAARNRLGRSARREDSGSAFEKLVVVLGAVDVIAGIRPDYHIAEPWRSGVATL